MNKNRTENIVDGEVTLAKLDTTGATAGQSIIMGASAPAWGTIGTATYAEELSSGGGTFSYNTDRWTTPSHLEAEGNVITTAGTFIGDGAGITGIADTALSANVALLDGDNTFTGNNAFTGGLTFTGLAIASGKTLTVSKTMTLTSSDDTSVITLPAGTKTLASTDGSVAGLASGSSTFTYDADDGNWVTADVVKANAFNGSGEFITGIVDSALSSNVPLKNAANAYTNTASYQPGAAYDTAALGAELLDDTTWMLGTGWTYASGTDWTQGFVHSGKVTSVASAPTNGGTGYTLDDVLTIETGDKTATVTATGVTDGVVTEVTLTSGGTTGYRGGTGQATSGGTGNGCTVNVTAIEGGTGTLTHDDTCTPGNYYKVSWTVTGRTGGTFSVSYGGTGTSGQSSSGNYTPKATTNAGLVFTPTTGFDGTVVLSVVPVTLYAPTIAVKDSSGNNSIEMRNSTASLNNIYIGLNTGRYSTTSYNNVGVGSSALGAMSSGDNNTAVGYNALGSVIGGRYNTACGSGALRSLTHGAQNIGIGYYAGSSITYASANVFIGYSSGNSNTGGNSVGIGYNTLYSSQGGCIAIGYAAGKYETSANAFYINNKDQTNTEKEKANSLLYGVMGATAANQTLQVGGKLKIDPTNPVGGYTAPTEALDVVGNIKASGGVTANTFPLIQWRGSLAGDPTENLSEGQMYWNAITEDLKVYTGAAWIIIGTSNA